MPSSYSLRKTFAVLTAASSCILGVDLKSRDPSNLKLEDELDAVSLVTGSSSNNNEVLLQEHARANSTVNTSLSTRGMKKDPTKAELQHKQLEMEQELEKIVNLVGKIGTSGAKTAPVAANSGAGLAEVAKKNALKTVTTLTDVTTTGTLSVARNRNNYLDSWEITAKNGQRVTLKDPSTDALKYIDLHPSERAPTTAGQTTEGATEGSTSSGATR